MAERLWYVVQTYSGYENTVKDNLQMRIDTMDMQDFIFNVVIPEETYKEVKNGKEKEVVKKLFPGYVFIDMIVTDESWYVVRNTPGVTGFLGSSGKGAKPVPLSPEEVAKMINKLGIEQTETPIDFIVGDKVRVCDGPFADQVGSIEEIDENKRLINVLVEFFGRATLIEIGVDKVEKI